MWYSYIYTYMGESMQTGEKVRKSPKRIVFNISEDDHEQIKKLAASKRKTMRDWIIDAIAVAIKIDQSSV